MADVININYPDMQQVGKRFQQQQQQIANMERRLNSAVKSLHANGWVGLGSDAFFNEMEGKVLPAVKRLSEALDEACRAVSQISNTMSQAEQAAANIFPKEEA